MTKKRVNTKGQATETAKFIEYVNQFPDAVVKVFAVTNEKSSKAHLNPTSAITFAKLDALFGIFSDPLTLQSKLASEMRCWESQTFKLEYLNEAELAEQRDKPTASRMVF